MAKTAPLSAEMIAFFRVAPEVIPDWPREVTVHGFGHLVFKDIAQSDWKEHEDRMVTHWDWWKWHQKFSETSARFECAIRLRGILMGLILGVHKSEATPPRLEIWYLEGRPGFHALKGQMLVLLMDLAYYYAVTI